MLHDPKLKAVQGRKRVSGGRSSFSSRFIAAILPLGAPISIAKSDSHGVNLLWKPSRMIYCWKLWVIEPRKWLLIEFSDYYGVFESYTKLRSIPSVMVFKEREKKERRFTTGPPPAPTTEPPSDHRRTTVGAPLAPIGTSDHCRTTAGPPPQPDHHRTTAGPPSDHRRTTVGAPPAPIGTSDHCRTTPAPQQSDLKSNPQQPQSTKNDQQIFKKDIFVIKHQISHEIDRHEDDDDPTALNPSSIAGDGQSRNSGGSRTRTSSCTKEEVDAILIQCGRFSQSNSAGSQNPNRRRRYSRSNTSYDFDLDTSLKNDDGDDEAMNNHRQWSDGGRRGREARLPRVGMEKKTARWGLQKFGAVVATRKTQAGGGDGFRRRGETDGNGSNNGNGVGFRRALGG
ncbi:hypothetical protein LXL04_030122 [Taraxacum kok-saghyz]